MKLETRSADEQTVLTPEQTQTPPTASKSGSGGGKKPVIVYIMILFIAAFLLMALSFFMHQRSNTEALGKLQDSVTGFQRAQEKNLELTEELKRLEDTLEKCNEQLETTDKQLGDALAAQTALQEENAALLQLYTLMQQYANGQYDACRQTIALMEQACQPARLPSDAGTDGVTSPAQRYQQLKDAVDQQPAT